MMKISYNPNIFYLFKLISHLKYHDDGGGGGGREGGGGQPIPAGLPPTHDFSAVIGFSYCC